MSARPNASGVSKDEAMVERALAALAKKLGWKPNDGTRDDIRTVLEAALASAAPAGEGDEYRRGYEDGVRATKASPYYDDSADTKPATPAGGGGELPEGGVRLRPGDKLLAVIGEGWVIVEDPLNYYIVREANGSDVIKSARGNDEAEFLAALIRRLASTGSAPAPSAVPEWFDDVRRCLDDVAIEFRARGRDDTRFVRLVHRMDATPAAPTQEQQG